MYLSNYTWLPGNGCVCVCVGGGGGYIAMAMYFQWVSVERNGYLNFIEMPPLTYYWAQFINVLLIIFCIFFLYYTFKIIC